MPTSKLRVREQPRRQLHLTPVSGATTAPYRRMSRFGRQRRRSGDGSRRRYGEGRRKRFGLIKDSIMVDKKIM